MPGARYEQGIEGGNQLWCRTPIDLQAVASQRDVTGLKIGKDVSASKAVYGLLRIADKEEYIFTTRVYCFEDGILDRIGILKFINKSGFVFFAKRCGKLNTPIALKGSLKIDQQVIKGTDILFLLSLRKLSCDKG